MSEKPCQICGGDHSTGFCTTAEGKELLGEQAVKRAHEKMRSVLLDRKILSSDELDSLSADRLDELLVRSGHEFAQLPEQIPETAEKKVRRMLGFPESQEEKVDSERRRQEMEVLITEMRGYLDAFKKHQPNLVGMILCGSRMDQKKNPSPTSDVDVVLVFEEGFQLDPSTAEGEKILFHLRDFSDSVRTDSGLEVELDAFFGSDTLVQKLEAADPEMLVWGWNAEATRYIGDAFAEMDEEVVNATIHSTLSGEDFEKKRRELIRSAAQAFLSN